MDEIRCMVMRGGSSKGAYFLADDLPPDSSERDDLLRRVMGSPDARQIDGLGGAHPLTSKVAVVGANTDGTADVDYLFLQVGVDSEVVTDRQNCGNLLAGVGPFALERGLVDHQPEDGPMTLRIRMVNTDSVATTTFGVADGRPQYQQGGDGQAGEQWAGEDVAISGVPGRAAPIRLDFEDLAGGSTGALLPTGNPVDEIEGVACTLIDNGMPVVVMAAADLGIDGAETCAELEANTDLRTRLEAIRLTAGRAMNLGDVTDLTVPKLTLVSPPRAGGDLCTRTFIPHRCHDAIGVLGAVSVATAALLPHSSINTLLSRSTDTPNDTVTLEHPTGTFDAVVALSDPGSTAGMVTVERAGIIRTARKIMDGTVFPRR